MYNFLYIIYIKSGGRRGIDCFSKEKQSTSYHDVDEGPTKLKRWKEEKREGSFMLFNIIAKRIFYKKKHK